jgi:hypothetical protein
VHIEQGAGFAIGPHARGRAERVHQVNKNIDITLLADELTLLREAMKKESSTADQDTAVGAIAAAEIAARAGNTKKMRSHLKSAGKWAFDVATKIGISVAAKALEPYIK